MNRVFVVDGQYLVREGIRSILARRAEFAMVGEASEATGALALIGGVAPDVVLVNSYLPGSNGLAVIQEIQQRSERTKVLLLTPYSGPEWIAQIFRAGAAGYVSSGIGGEDLLRALRAAAVGESFLALPMAEVPGRYGGLAEEFVAEGLTKREREILALVAGGGTVRSVANRLSISLRTVQTHLGHVMGKAGVHNRADLVRFAVRRGLIRP